MLTLYSFMLAWMCLIPSQNTFVQPWFKKIKIPVLPKVWWNGKKAILTSVLKKFSTLFMAEIFDAIFLWDNITAFDLEVVPDVNKIILILLSSIFASINSLLPFSTSLLPSSIKSPKYKKPACFSSSLIWSIQINFVTSVVPEALNFFIVSI